MDVIITTIKYFIIDGAINLITKRIHNNFTNDNKLVSGKSILNDPEQFPDNSVHKVIAIEDSIRVGTPYAIRTSMYKVIDISIIIIPRKEPEPVVVIEERRMLVAMAQITIKREDTSQIIVDTTMYIDQYCNIEFY